MLTVRQHLQGLHVAAKTCKFAAVELKLTILMQKADFTERPLPDETSFVEEGNAQEFWSILLNTPRNRLDVLSKSAHCVLAVIGYTYVGTPMTSMKGQAVAFCDEIAQVCEKLLSQLVIETKALPPRRPTKLTVYQGGLP